MTRLVLAIALFAIAPVAQAQSIDVAEEADLQFELGVEAYRKGEYLVALDHLLSSNRLAPNKNVVFNIARAYEKLERYDEAFRHYSDYLAVETDPARRTAAEEAVGRIRSRVALVRVESNPPGATIYVDRRDLGARGVTPRVLALDPGAHTILLGLDGYTSVTSPAVDIAVGREVAVSLGLEPIRGRIQVDGKPLGAEIRVDDEAGPVVGRIPALVDLPPGPHVIVVTAPGYRPSREVVKVNADETSPALVDLALVTGIVVVNAIDRDALIEIDGQAVGFTPAVLPAIPAGDHTIRVTLSGFRPFEQPITVAADQQVTVDVRLRSLQEVTAASRTSESAEDAPASVSLISGEEIRAFGYQTVFEALGGTRGVFQTNDLTYEYLGFRGFSRTGDYGNRLLVTLDGHTTNDDQLGASYVGRDFMSDLLDVERIEVVRGPGSALYGTNAFFGVINVVTRDAAESRPAHVSVAADGVRGMRARAGTHVAFEDGGGLTLSAGGTVSQGDDFYFPAYDQGEVGADGWSRDADGSRSGTMLAKAEKGDFTVQGYWNSRSKRIPTGAYGTTLGHPRAHSDDHRGFVEGRWEPSFGEKAQLYSRAYVDAYSFRGDYPYDEPPNYVASDAYDGVWAGVEPRFVLSPGEAFRLTAGAEARFHLRSHLTGTEYDYEDEIGTYLDEEPGYQVYSAYAVGDLKAGDALHASVGARVDSFSTFGLAVNPRLAIVANPSEADTIKLMAGRAFRAPSPYELYYNDGGFSQVSAPSLSPETIWTTEIEATHRFSDVTTLTGSVYYDDITSLIDLGEKDDGLLQYENTEGSVRTLGTEIEVRRDWRAGWMVAANYAYQRTREDVALVGLLFGDPRDGLQTNSPEYLASVKAAAPVTAGAKLASRLRFESARQTEFATWTNPALLWDITATGEVASARLLWALGVRNALDWDVQHPGGVDLAQEVLPQQGRTLFAEATISF